MYSLHQFYSSIKHARLWRIITSCLLASGLLISCGGGGGGGDDDSPEVPISTDAGALISGICGSSSVDTSSLAQVSIDGQITFDRVPTSSSNGLDYSAITQEPARQVTVQACNASGIFASTTTDDSGNYTFNVPANTELRILVKAEMLASGSPSWDVSVVDNTRQKAMYGIAGQLVSSSAGNSTRNLNAPHGGWNGAAYTSARSAAPFAILDTVYESMAVILPLNPTADFPALLVNWSVDNRRVTSDFNEDIGNLASSFYRSSDNQIFILGKADENTDEYDVTVISHEWGHYFQNTFSRSDNIGGTRTDLDKLDLRLAYDEGLNYVFSAVIGESANLRDTAGPQQGFTAQWSAENTNSFLVGNVPVQNKGWFSENSVINIIYDVIDGGSESGDAVNVGFDGLYNLLTSDAYLNFEGALSIYAFADLLREANPASSAAINDLLVGEDVFGTADAFGTGEVSGGEGLPVYFDLSPGTTTNVCSTRINGGFSRLGTRRLGRIVISTAGDYRIVASNSSSGSAISTSDPDFFVYQQGNVIFSSNSDVADTETGNVTLASGEYWIELYEFSNVFAFISDARLVSNFEVSANSEACFDISLQAL